MFIHQHAQMDSKAISASMDLKSSPNVTRKDLRGMNSLRESITVGCLEAELFAHLAACFMCKTVSQQELRTAELQIALPLGMELLQKCQQECMALFSTSPSCFCLHQILQTCKLFEDHLKLCYLCMSEYQCQDPVQDTTVPKCSLQEDDVS